MMIRFDASLLSYYKKPFGILWKVFEHKFFKQLGYFCLILCKPPFKRAWSYEWGLTYSAIIYLETCFSVLFFNLFNNFFVENDTWPCMNLLSIHYSIPGICFRILNSSLEINSCRCFG